MSARPTEREDKRAMESAIRGTGEAARSGTLVVTPSRCTGCRTCELACAISHGEPMRPARSRIRAFTFSEKENVPVMCLQCEDAACVKVCPVEALARNARTGAVEVSTERCVRCMLCVSACPFGNICEDQGTGRIVKCDLCGGDPICAKFCPSGALSMQGR